MSFLERARAAGVPVRGVPEQADAGGLLPLATVGSPVRSLNTADTSYGLAALAGLCQQVAEAGATGGRDVAFNQACLRAGDLIREGDLTRQTAETALRVAGMAVIDAGDFTAYKVSEKLDRVINQGVESTYVAKRSPAPELAPPLRAFVPQTVPQPAPDLQDEAEPAQVAGEPQEPDVEALHRLRVTAALHDLRVKHEAQTLHRAELAARTFRVPEFRSSLTAELLMPDPPVEYAVDQLLPLGGNALLAAQYKTGKTTTVGDLARAYADGVPFLGRFHVNPGEGRIALWNYELSDSQYRRWLRELGIRNTDRVVVMHLRGFRLPLTSPTVEDWVVQWLQDHEVTFWVPDPFARAAVGTDENSNTEVGVWLDTLDVIKERAGVRDLVMPTHTGRAEQEMGQERARGATRLDDWADVRWLLTKDKDDNRYFRATGRDVELPEGLLTYDEGSRRLQFGEGDRRGLADRQAASQVLAYVAQHKGCTTRDISDMGGNKVANQKALKALLEAGAVSREVVKEGRTTVFHHYIQEDQR